ncbi:GNAT family N-acetyltransferase [Alteromonas macleodii]|uniref:GNAT family N-acetyltransferase n=1 Tax=Alteromonas macleodii TaxID=28108 RepID=UPI00313D58A7
MAVSVHHKNLASLEEAKSFLRGVHRYIDAPTPFTSLIWQESWVSSLEVLPILYTFKLGSQTIGYCWIASKNPLSFLPLSSWYMNQTGVAAQDQVWVEYNTIICSKKHEQACLTSLLKKAKVDHICKLYISMSHDIAISKDLTDNSIRVDSENVNGYRTFLITADLEKHLSKNTRSQIRRSTKLLEQDYGAISVIEASKEQLHSYLEKLGSLHKEKWGKSAEGSGFNNPLFLSHHKHLLENFPENVSIIEIKAGTTLLGYSYNLIFGDTVYFYCSGINYQYGNNKIKPGYTLHSTLMEYYRKKGFHWYDFLGGESRYKESLSTETYIFKNLTIYTRSIEGRLSSALQRIKQKLFLVAWPGSPQQ